MKKKVSIMLRVIILLFLLLTIAYAAMLVDPIRRSVGYSLADTVQLSLHLVMVLPVLAALFDGWQMFTAIGQNNSFCMENARRLHRICVYALADTALLLCITVWRCLAGDDLLLLYILFLLGGASVAIIAQALSQLTAKAAQLQDENDLTI